MAQYAGNPNNWPKDFTKLDSSSNGANPATWNVPYEALGDRTAYELRSLATQIAHFDRQFAVTALSAASPYTGRPAYQKKHQQWWVGRPQEALSSGSHFAVNKVRYSSFDPVQHTCAFINDPSNPRYGNGLFIPLVTSQLRFTFDDAAGTFTGATDLPSATWAVAQHNAQNDLWLIASSGKLYTSPTSAIAWTVRTLPGGGTMFPTPPVTDGTTTMLVGKTKGLYTSNDLVTWTELTTAFGLTGITGLVYDAFRERFVVWVTNGTSSSEVWASDDSGASWTLLSTVPIANVFEMHSVGPTIVGWHLTGVTPTDNWELVYSIDGGVTWGRAPSSVCAEYDSSPQMASNGSELMAVRLGNSRLEVAFSLGFSPITF